MIKIIVRDLNNKIYELDNNPTDNIELTYQIKDIKEIDKRKSTYSKTVTLPGTPNNNKFFQNLYNVNSVTLDFKPNKRVSVSVQDDSIEILSGVLQLTSVKIKPNSVIEYEVVLIGSLVDFAKQLGEKLLTKNVSETDDLKFPEIQSKLNTMSYNNYWGTFYVGWPGGIIPPGQPNYCNPLVNSDDSPNGFVYTLGDYDSNWSDSNPVSAVVNEKGMLPSIFVKRIWDKIFTAANFRYKSDFLNTLLFKKLIFINPSRDKERTYKTLVYAEQNIGYSQSATGTSTPTINFFSTLVNTQGSAWNGSNTYTATVSGTHNIKGFIKVNSTNAAGYSGKLQLVINGTVTQIKTFSGDRNDEQQIDYNFLQTLSSGDTVSLALKYDVQLFVGSIFTTSINYRNYLEIGTDANPLLVSELLPANLKQIDFIMSIVKMFNLMIEPNPDNPRELLIEPLDAYYASGIVKDWSKKLDRNSEIEISLASLLTKKKINYKHKKSSDFENIKYKDVNNFEYGEATIDVDNDFLDDIDKIETEFQPTIVKPVDGYSGLFLPKLFDIDKEGSTLKVEIGNRIAIIYGVKYTASSDTITVDNINTWNMYPLVSMFENPFQQNSQSILFGNSINYINASSIANSNNLYVNYHQNEISNISGSNSKFLKAKFTINASDISKLRFNDKIYLNIENNPSYWFISKIVYTTDKTKLCDVELIQINDLTTNNKVILNNNGTNPNGGSGGGTGEGGGGGETDGGGGTDTDGGGAA